jgi:hypothetical protein
MYLYKICYCWAVSQTWCNTIRTYRIEIYSSLCGIKYGLHKHVNRIFFSSYTGPRCVCAVTLQAHCTYPILWKFPLAPPGAPTSTTMRETSSREKGNYGREITGNFADNGDFHAVVGIFYMLQICDMRETALLPLRRKACWGFFRPEKSDGFGRFRSRELGYQGTLRSLLVILCVEGTAKPNLNHTTTWR